MVVDHLPLRKEIRYALLGAQNPERGTLCWIERYEHGDWAECDVLAATLGIPQAMMSQMYIDSLEWARANLPLEMDSSE